MRAKFPQRETDGCKMGRAKLESADFPGEKGGTETGKTKQAWKSSGGEVGVRSGLKVKKGCTVEFVHEAPKPSRWLANGLVRGKGSCEQIEAVLPVGIGDQRGRWMEKSKFEVYTKMWVECKQ